VEVGNQLCIEYAELEAKKCTLVLELVWANVIYIRTIKSRRIRWAGHVAQIREKSNAYRNWWEGQKERDH
jgi:hypothetical protein